MGATLQLVIEQMLGSVNQRLAYWLGQSPHAPPSMESAPIPDTAFDLEGDIAAMCSVPGECDANAALYR